MRTRTVLTVLSLACLLSAALAALKPAGTPRASAPTATSAQRGDWWMFGRNPQHARCSPFSGPATPTLEWSITLGGGNHAASWTPLSQAADGTLYAGAYHLFALNPDGTVKWVFPCHAVWSTPAIGKDGTLYFGSDDHKFYALSPEGEQVWALTFGEAVRSSPAIGGEGTIYVCVGDRLYALTTEGNEKWHYEAGERAAYCPAIGCDGAIYFTGSDFDQRLSPLYALSPAGELLWKCPLSDYCHSPVVAPDGTIYVDGMRMLFAVSPEGELRWQREINSVNYTDPAIGTDGTVYVGGGEKLQALSPDGDVIWEAPIPDTGGVYSCPAIGADGTIYLGGGFNNTIYAFRPDGSLLWEYEAGGAVNCAPLIAPDGTLFIADWNRTLYAFTSSRTSKLP